MYLRICRRYMIDADTCSVLLHGKGGGGERNAVFPVRQEACGYINRKLTWRLSAHKRIGCHYCLIIRDGAPDLLRPINQKVRTSFFGKQTN